MKLESVPARLTGLAWSAIAIGMLFSAIVGVLEGDSDVTGLVVSGLVVGAAGLVVLRSTVIPARQNSASAFAGVAWTWLLVSLAGVLPYLLTGTIDWSNADDALFESVSGFTCSGSTILSSLEDVDRGVLFWRSLSQWFGGMGLIVLAVAVLPALRVGGLELVATEAPGPTSDRLTARVGETAKRLWLLYAGLTAAHAAALILSGLDLYDAVTHAFTTLSTGGFSPYSASVAHFDSAVVEAVIVAGMLIGGANFALHYQAIRGRPASYLKVSEFRLYIGLFVMSAVVLTLINTSLDDSLSTTARDAVFNAATVVTSTGFATADFVLWGASAQLLLLVLMVPAGMTGSTSGGIKLFRVQVVVSSGFREIVRSRHSRAVLPVRLGETIVPERVITKVTGFVMLYLMLLLGGGMIVTSLGTDPVTAFSGAASAIGNIGPALGEAGPSANFLVFPRLGRMVLAALMLFGRLELFPTMLMFASAARYVRRRRRLLRPLPARF